MPKDVYNSHYEKLPNGEVRCIDDEIPFEIPSNWCWVRLSQVVQINPKNKADDNIEAAFIPMELIDATYFSSFTFETKKWKTIKGGFTHFADGDIAFAKITPCFQNRKSMILQNLPNGIGAGTTELKVLRPYAKTINDFYLLFFLESAYFVEQATFKGTANQQRIISGYMENKLFPLPPIDEQERIAEKLKTLLLLADKYGESQIALNKLNDELPKIMKQSILQEAIQGRLVEQCEADEPATELLKRIQQEKQKLVKEGKLKAKDITDSIIYKGDDNKYYEQIGKSVVCIDAEIPFEIPNTWLWARIKTLYKTTSGGTPEKGHPEYYGGTIPWAKVGDLEDMFLSEAEEKITDAGLEHSSAKIFPEDTILIAMYCNDAIGKSSILTSPMCTNQAICGLYPNPLLNKEYVYYAVQANRKRLQEQSAGGAQKNINQKIVNELIIPIPPIKEQGRIVSKIMELYSKL